MISYLDKEYQNSISNVLVTDDKVQIAGKVANTGIFLLAEINPYEHATELDNFELDLIHLTGLLDKSALTVRIEFEKMTKPERERTTEPKKKAVEPKYAKSNATEVYRGLD